MSVAAHEHMDRSLFDTRSSQVSTAVHSVPVNLSGYGLVGNMILFCILLLWPIQSTIGIPILIIIGVILPLFPDSVINSGTCSHNSVHFGCAIRHCGNLTDENCNFSGGTCH